ncbi:tripartite tricarboxylate transporter permease [Roseibium salinum]|nr:tripartite tricarboxylate transporter permease [Roseibium salinum]
MLILCAPFLAVMVEAYLDLPEKTALLILSLAFISSVIGRSVGKGLISMGLGLLVAYIGTGEDFFYPRLSFGTRTLAEGFPVATVILGVLILGEVFRSFEDLWMERRQTRPAPSVEPRGDQRLHWADIRRLAPYIGRSALIGTAIGALPGIGSTLAAMLGYAAGGRLHAKQGGASTPFGKGAPEGVAATEAANSAVSGANLIPVLSLGIPGNAAAVFLILAADSIGGFNPGPSVFRWNPDVVNPELVIAFGLFTAMMFANLLNWTIGGVFMRSVGVMSKAPKHILMPIVLLLTLTAIYVEEASMAAMWFAVAFGILGYLMRRLDLSPLPFVIAFILGGNLEQTARQAFAATGGDPFFLFTSPIAAVFMALAVTVVAFFVPRRAGGTHFTACNTFLML